MGLCRTDRLPDFKIQPRRIIRAGPQGKVPPFFRIACKACLIHQAGKALTVQGGFRGYVARSAPAAWVETVKWRAEIMGPDIGACTARTGPPGRSACNARRANCQIDCVATRMARPRRNVAAINQAVSGQARIIAPVITIRPSNPGDERSHRPGWPVAVKYHQRLACCRQLLLDRNQRLRRRPRQQAAGCTVARHAAAGEIVGRGVAHVQPDCGVKLVKVDPAVRQRWRVSWVGQRQSARTHGQCGQAGESFSDVRLHKPSILLAYAR
jgi:hypothetical protein